MKFFEKYVSNTVAGSANQLFFSAPNVTTGRIFYKIYKTGAFNYSLLFSNIIDSTFSNGAKCHKNVICDEWQLHGAKIGRCRSFPDKPLKEVSMDEVAVTDLTPLTFNGSESKTVAPAELFNSDPIPLYFEKGDYLCLEMTFSGDMVPYHEESIIPIYVKNEDGWYYSKKCPVASMIGCDRDVTARVGYIGDSITQGIGAPYNSYLHWNARLSDMLPDSYAYWNLGIGYGRANDFASDGAWLYKAQHNDIIFVCYGVNDINQGFSEEQIRLDITHIVKRLKGLDKTVILQTIPPFNYKGERIDKWMRLNEYIKTELSGEADFVFDCVPVLSKSKEEPYNSKYGGHPDAEGGRVWAEALYECIKDIIK